MQRERNPHNYGPISQILHGPILLVYGTTGTLQETANRLEAAVFISNWLWYQGRYSIPIVADTQLPNDAQNYNLILLGGPITNAITRQFAAILPVLYNGRIFTIGKRIFNEPNTGIVFLAPWGSERLIAVLSGTDEDGFKKSFAMLPFKSATTLPDYAVAGPSWGWAGNGGLLAAGFWDNNWEFNPQTGYIRNF